MAKNQTLTIGALREELDKQGISIKEELQEELDKQGISIKEELREELDKQGISIRKEFKKELDKQEKKFEGFVKEESKKYMRQMHFLDRDFQKRQDLMVEAIGELNDRVGRVEGDVSDIREMVGKNTMDIQMIKFDIQEIKETKVSRDELVPGAFVRKQ